MFEITMTYYDFVKSQPHNFCKITISQSNFVKLALNLNMHKHGMNIIILKQTFHFHCWLIIGKEVQLAAVAVLFCFLVVSFSFVSQNVYISISYQFKLYISLLVAYNLKYIKPKHESKKNK